MAACGTVSPGNVIGDYAKLCTLPAPTGVIFAVCSFFQFGGLAAPELIWANYTLTSMHATVTSIAVYMVAFAKSKTKTFERCLPVEQALIVAGPVLILAHQFTAIGHTGKDVAPEVKRLATLPAFKSDRTTAEFLDVWPADAAYPTNRKFGGPVEEIEPAVDGYTADDAAPRAWNPPEELFSRDLDWPEMQEWLRDPGPAES